MRTRPCFDLPLAACPTSSWGPFSPSLGPGFRAFDQPAGTEHCAVARAVLRSRHRSLAQRRGPHPGPEREPRSPPRRGKKFSCRADHGRAELSVPCFTSTDKFCKPVSAPAAWRSGSSVRSVQLARLSLFSKSACLGEFSPRSSAGRGLAPELRPPRAAAPLPSACERPERAAAAALGGLSRFGAFPPSDTR